MKKLLLLALICAASCFGACTGSSPTWTCADTGNSATNGTNLRNLLLSGAVVCGDTIILTHGANYDAPAGAPFQLPAQTGCASADTRTSIESDNLSMIPQGAPVVTDTNSANIANMARMRGGPTPDAGVIFIGGSNNWALRGIITTCEDTGLNWGTYMQPIRVSFDPVLTTAASAISNHMTYDRFFSAPLEYFSYGPISNWYDPAQGNGADVNTWETHFRCLGVAAMQIEGNDNTIVDSATSISGFDPTPSVAVEFSVTSAVAANPAQLVGTGIATTLGLTGTASACDATAYGNAVCREAVIRGATGSWSTLNGAKFLLRIDDNTVSVFEAVPARISTANAFPLATAGGYPFNATGFGALTGTVQGKKAFPVNPAYNVLMEHGGDGYHFKNNWHDGWSMNIFTAGGLQIEAHTATIQTSSTWDSLILDSDTGLSTGDLVAFPATGRSTYCGSSSWGCWNGGLRVGRVTGITGTGPFTVALEPYGTDGVDSGGAPTIGGTADWNGIHIKNMEFRRSTLRRSIYEPLDLSGKGYFEIKDCQQCLIDGNLLENSPAGNWFVTAHNQGGYNPWNSVSYTVYSNNVAGGPAGSNTRLTSNGEDPEHTNSPGTCMRFDNNVLPGMRFPDPSSGTGSFSTFDTFGGYNGTSACNGWFHNTAIALSSPATHTMYKGSDSMFTPVVLPNSYGAVVGQAANNIFSYGEGSSTTSNWTDYNDLTNEKNIFVADGSVSTTTINTTNPGNYPVANNAAIGFVGTCAFATWEQCAVDPTSTYFAGGTDGYSPGADVPQVKDRINGWSEDAGLLTPDLTVPAMVITWAPADTTSSPTFTITDVIGNCSAHLYTNPVRTTEHADTSTTSACNRTGNTVVGSTVTFVFGHDSALTSNTTYYYKITDGSRVMVGNFTTSNTPTAPTITTTCPLPGDTVGSPYSQTLTATGSTPITWTIPTGSLPSGLSLSGATISGTPTTVQVATFTIQATNSVGASTNGPVSCSITINSGTTFIGGKGRKFRGRGGSVFR